MVINAMEQKQGRRNGIGNMWVAEGGCKLKN